MQMKVMMSELFWVVDQADYVCSNQRQISIKHFWPGRAFIMSRVEDGLFGWKKFA